uniref:ML domain-containing protein n=1 Tax=Panagrellus redivivus TaxID=6233 RepID=A0A7E4URW7_PANRE
MIAAFIALVFVTAATANPIVAKSCSFPNGTDVGLHYYNCDGNQAMKINNATIFTQDGAPMYPIDPRKPMYLELDALNNGIVYTDNKVKVKILDYGTSWLSSDCAWNEIPTFGLLDGLDGCDYAHNCPLQTGKLDLRLPLDFSQYAAIVNVLAGNRPYQLEVRMFDNNPGSQQEEIACVITQLRFSE